MSLTDDRALDYLCRSSGLVLLLLFTACVVLGLLTAGRISAPGWPRFLIQSLHRNLGLISVVLLFIHILAPVVGSYLGLKLAYAFIPFATAPIRIWTRFAAMATDLTLFVMIVSAARVRAGYRFWRGVHLLSYLAWVFGMIHATGIGGDHDTVLWCDVLCVTVVGLAGWYRLRTRHWLAKQRVP